MFYVRKCCIRGRKSRLRGTQGPVIQRTKIKHRPQRKKKEKMIKTIANAVIVKHAPIGCGAFLEVPFQAGSSAILHVFLYQWHTVKNIQLHRKQIKQTCVPHVSGCPPSWDPWCQTVTGMTTLLGWGTHRTVSGMKTLRVGERTGPSFGKIIFKPEVAASKPLGSFTRVMRWQLLHWIFPIDGLNN
jgi:hypothetical protein